jgi:alpha,alpha-trehalase
MAQVKGPDEIYGELFALVQRRRVFRDSKTFADAVPKHDVAQIMAAFAKLDVTEDQRIRAFVEEHFDFPATHDDVSVEKVLPPRERIEQLWDLLSRAADRVHVNSSLLELPRPYIVPGGRFREVYYWDSYFTMLGLAEAQRFDRIEDMVENFAYLIDHIGFIPNGNRSYFCTRSQPPFFVLMVELLASVRNDPAILRRYRPQLLREYDFWMAGADTLTSEGSATHRRADKDRERWIELLAAEPASEPGGDGLRWRVRLRTQHGTYVKEVLSGDGGNTTPSLASLIGVPCRCVELDVLAILDAEGDAEPESRLRPPSFGAGL